ncbi:cobalamin biosynthesis protein [Nocardia aurantiaca]|uniref:Cobalamin biosynthesis protein n=1 Tax=Nocardia aurantiaca TaxID=2675850 RepID=A0A6I3KWL0_9NOCA|nr:cobalamin biosynthesis protein [Nocardia aurantiaca]MTE12865.1 cobalamin biosynthesis protein [Nocardia aurantiaca]
MPPPDLAVGVGLRAGTPADEIVAVVHEVVGDRVIRCLATIDRRIREPGIAAAAVRLGVELIGFSSAELGAVAVPNPSGKVSMAVGAASVAEAAAVLGSRGGDLVIAKTVICGMVIAAAECVS